MSYILDALLKAEQERQRSAVPSLQSVASYPAETRSPPPPRSRLALLSIGVALCAAGLAAILFQRPGLPAANAPTAAVATAPATAIAPRPPAVREAPAAIVSDNSTPPAPLVAAPRQPAIAPSAITPPATAPAAARPAPSRVAKAPAMANPQPPAKPLVKDEVAATDSTAANRDRILDISELPAALRQEVDKNVVVSGLSLSPDNGEHLAIINDRARHTGDDIIAGMTLERIQPDGVILRYKGYRFRRGLY
ncbi:general secretion pathway protein GspB [Vogesella sp. GCM10023246]|uniref:General secretion pathway protein GspB n=1 Tax=Vogesella oryzagri TaxID=3160864 RepID=A0ABV1M7D7_9NEIS